MRSARPGDDGTNIGDAIAVGLDALLVASPKKKVLVLLTDGNNEPAVPHPLDPEQAADPGPRPGRDPAHDRDRTDRRGHPGHRSGRASCPVCPRSRGPISPLLERLAQLTGGRSFAATDADALAEVFRTIDALEKSPVRGQILTRYDEHYRTVGGDWPWAF